MNARRRILAVCLAAALIAAALQAYGFMADRREAAIKARADMERCGRIAAIIEALRARPAVACEAERLAAETTGLTERAARSAGIAPGSLVRITPAPPRRVGESVYKEKPTQVLLKNVTLRQLVTMVHALGEADAGLQANSIRLTSPGRDDDGLPLTRGVKGGLWTAEVVLTYLIYDPPPRRG